MTTRPSSLPFPPPPPLDLTDPTSLTWWCRRPSPFRGKDGAAFWESVPPLTAPQYLALRLGRHPEHVSATAVQALSDHWRRNSLVWDSVRLARYVRLWRRTHETMVFRFDPDRLRRPSELARGNPLRALLGWITAATELDARFLLAGSSPRRSRRESARRVHDYLRKGAELGYILDLRVVSVPVLVYRPSATWCRRMGVTPPRWKESALEHGQLAVEAALRLMAADESGVASLRALRSEADLLSEQRLARARPLTGDELGGVVDLEVERHAGVRLRVEVLSEDYRDADIAAKAAALPSDVHFVATSRTLGQRAARVIPPGLSLFHL